MSRQPWEQGRKRVLGTAWRSVVFAAFGAVGVAGIFSLGLDSAAFLAAARSTATPLAAREPSLQLQAHPSSVEGTQSDGQAGVYPGRQWAFSGLAAAAAAALAGLRQRRGSAQRWPGRHVKHRVAGAAEGEDGTKALAKPPIWVVNLDKSVGRWEKCQDEFAKQNVNAERFPATLGKAMTDEELAEQTTFGARYFCTPGMIGCFMSHLRIWQKVADQGIPAVVVLEDDVVLFPDFDSRLQTLQKELPADWDVCLLGAVGCIATEKEALHMKLYALITGGGRPSPGKTRGISEHIYVPYRPAGTHAYMVSLKGAQALVRMCPKPQYHVDLTAWALPDLKLYSAKEFLATQRFDDDTTVSKEGAPLTRRFLRWCWDFTGLSNMGKRAGVPNLTWAWTIACFALPVPFSSSRRRIIVEMGPSTSLFVLILLSSFLVRSAKPVGVGLIYMASIIWVIRALNGTQKVLPIGTLFAMGAAFLWFG